MSNRPFQGLVVQMHDTIHATIGVVDETATIIACSDPTRVGTTNEFVSMDMNESGDLFIRNHPQREILLVQFGQKGDGAFYHKIIRP